MESLVADIPLEVVPSPYRSIIQPLLDFLEATDLEHQDGQLATVILPNSSRPNGGDDCTYGIVDYKTSDAKEEHAAFYSRQLTAYAYALENPAPNALALSPVSRMGLFIITPSRFERTPADEVVFVNSTTWVDVPRDDRVFLSFLGEVMAVLDAPAPPPPSETCGLCAYRQSMEEYSG